MVNFEEKAASVLWYYERVAWLAERDELVVCVDEKTQIQALRRSVPDVPMRPGQDRRREWEYRRDGTVNLLVTYTPITGSLWGRVLPKNDHGHFIEGMEAYLATLPRTIRCLHCILDNGPSHIAKETQAWVAAHAGRVAFHFTPAHASWVNQAELALSAFSRRYLRDRVSQTWGELVAHIYRASTSIVGSMLVHSTGHSRGTLCMNGTLAELRRCCTSGRPSDLSWAVRSSSSYFENVSLN
jgi:hypothetical protein